MKVSDRHEFFEEIDLTKYTPPSGSGSSVYKLFAVLVHTGDLSASGHYYAFIRPNPADSEWFKFNDTQVERASHKQVFDYSFGGRVLMKTFDRNEK